MFCAIYRWKMSAAIDAGTPLSPAAERHVHVCASCRQFWTAAQGLHAALRDGAAMAPPRLAAPRPKAPPLQSTAAYWLAGAGAAVAAATVIVAVLMPRPGAPRPQVVRSPGSVEALALVAPLPDLPAAAGGAQQRVLDTANGELALAGQDAAALASTLVSYIKFDPAHAKER